MKMFLNKLGVMPSKSEIDEMFNLFDANGSGKIDFTEFLSLITRHLGNKQLPGQEDQKNDEILRESFNLFDLDHDGTLSEEDIYKAFTTIGIKNVTQKEIKKMIAEVDPLSTGFIDF